jgi:hypothetical protein
VFSTRGDQEREVAGHPLDRVRAPVPRTGNLALDQQASDRLGLNGNDVDIREGT